MHSELMTNELDQAMRAELERLKSVVSRFEAAIRQCELASQVALKSVTGPAFIAEVKEAVFEGWLADDSPFVERGRAHVRWGGSPSEIDKAVRMGILTRLKRGSGTLFEKAEGDAAIREGRWVPFDAKVAARLEKQTREA